MFFHYEGCLEIPSIMSKLLVLQQTCSYLFSAADPKLKFQPKGCTRIDIKQNVFCTVCLLVFLHVFLFDLFNVIYLMVL